MYAGYAKREITPEKDVYLAGNGEFKSEDIHDPLFARAIVFSDKNEWTAIVSADLIGVELEIVRKIRKLLHAVNCGNPENIFITCTHTHNGPHTRFARELFLAHRDEKYLKYLSKQITDAIIEADAAKQPVKMRYGRGYVFENFNRRVVFPNGQAYFYAPSHIKKKPEITQHVHGIADPELSALQLIKEDGSIFLNAVHYAAHPLTVGIYKNVITADFCGALVNKLEEHYGTDAVFIQGACGSLHSKGLFEGFERMEEMGSNLFKETTRIFSAEIPVVESPKLRVVKKAIKLPVDSERIKDNTEVNRALFRKTYGAEMGAIMLGPIAFVSSPGEMLCEPGLQIKWNSPFEQTWILYNCNSYCGYIAHRRVYHEGGYEKHGQYLASRACYIVLATAEKLLQSLWEATESHEVRYL